MSQVKLDVDSQLEKLIEDLAKVRESMKATQGVLQNGAKQTGETLKNQVKNYESGVNRMGGFTRRVFEQIKSDLKTLASLNSALGALKINSMFQGSIKESVQLNDTVRKLGTTFGLTSGEFSKFQAKMQKGLGDIGLSSEVAANALKGLSGTTVRGSDNILEYAKTGGMLASTTGAAGSEGDIAKGLAGLLKSRGIDPNNLEEMKKAANDVLAVFNATGASAQNTVSAMTSIYSAMPQDMRKSVTTSGLGQLAAVSQSAGPNSTAFLEEYLKMGKTQRMALDAQGADKIFNPDGSLNQKQFQQFAKNVQGRVGNDPRLAAQTLGISEDAAEGLVRLTENMDRLNEIQAKVAGSTAQVNDQYQKSMGLGEAFSANINKVKGQLSDFISPVTQTLTDVMSSQSGSATGAGAVVGGGALLSAMLLSGGLRGLGKTAMGFGKEQLFEKVTGEQVTPVRVINFDELSGMGLGDLGGKAGGVGGLLKKAAPVLGKAGLVAGAGAVGYGIGTGIDYLQNKAQFTSDDGFKGNAVEQLINAIDRLGGGFISRPQSTVRVELNRRDLKEATPPNRGKAN